MTSPRRHQTSTERDIAGIRAKQEREAAPDYECDDITGQYVGEELAQMRSSRRSTHQRIAILERKRDDDREALHSLELVVERVMGKLEAYIETVQKEREEAHKTERAHASTRAKIVVGIASALAAIAGAAITALAGCA